MWKGSWAPSRNLLPFMGGPGLQFGCMEFGRHTGPDRLPKGALPGAQNGAGSVPDASMERKRRHRVQYGFYLLRSTSAARIGVRNGLKNGTGRDIGLRLGLAPEKCFPRAPKGLLKWTPKCCKNEKNASQSRPDAERATSSSPCNLPAPEHLSELPGRPQSGMQKEESSRSELS